MQEEQTCIVRKSIVTQANLVKQESYGFENIIPNPLHVL